MSRRIGLLEQHYPAFIAHLAAQGRGLSEYVQRKFEDYLICGHLEHGVLRVRCESCHAEHLVAFSCKHRGFPPAAGCGAWPRMRRVELHPSLTRFLHVRIDATEIGSGVFAALRPSHRCGSILDASSHHFRLNIQRKSAVILCEDATVWPGLGRVVINESEEERSTIVFGKATAAPRDTRLVSDGGVAEGVSGSD